MNKFEVGDKVKVKEIRSGQHSDGFYVSRTMLGYCGAITTITEIKDSIQERYSIEADGGNWSWADYCLELVEEREKKMEIKVGDKVVVKKDLNLHDAFDGVFITEDMLKFAGKTVTIESYKQPRGTYQIKEDPRPTKRYWKPEFFEKKVENYKTINLVYVKMHSCSKAYLYEVPEHISLQKGEEVFVEVRSSKTHATVDCDSFTIPKQFYDELLDESLTSFARNLKKVTGLAKKEKFVEEPF